MTSAFDPAQQGAPDGDTRLRQQQRAAAILIGAAAHDLRTPLNTMAGWLQVLQAGQDLPAATRERAFKGLQSAVTQQTALADGLAQVAAIHTDETVLEIGAIDLGVALEAALRTIDAEARAKGVELELQPADAAVVLNSDSAMVAALLRQCLAGALKFAAKNSLLAVHFCLAPEQDGICLVRVDLDRSLLPAAGIAAILQYVEGGAIDKPSGAGAAFAFAVAQGIVRFLGGSMHAAQAVEGQDLSLTLTLPALR